MCLVAGSYGKDPLLFVHRGNQAAGLSVESGRLSRGLHRRAIRNVLAGLATAVVFVAMSYLTFVDRTRYAQAIDGDIVRVYQGHPDLASTISNSIGRLTMTTTSISSAMASEAIARRAGQRSLAAAEICHLEDRGIMSLKVELQSVRWGVLRIWSKLRGYR